MDVGRFWSFLVASKAHGGFHQIERSLLCRTGQVTASGGLIASSYSHLKFLNLPPAEAEVATAASDSVSVTAATSVSVSDAAAASSPHLAQLQPLLLPEADSKT